jgi:hypothetical protein
MPFLVLRLVVRVLRFGSILFLPIVFSTMVEEDLARTSVVGRIGTVFFTTEFGSLSRVVVGRGLRLLPGFLFLRLPHMEPDASSLLTKHFAWGKERDESLFDCMQIGGGFITGP